MIEGMTFLVGGARSGKSDLAQRLLRGADLPVSVIVTAEPGDDEMVERIRHHRDARPRAWLTVEAPRALATAVAGIPSRHGVLLDCLTFWVANRLLDGDAPEDIEREALEVAANLAGRAQPSVVVSNEVGHGLVPADALSRTFRDVHGRVNRIVADAAHTRLLVVAGHLLPLTSAEDFFGPLP